MFCFKRFLEIAETDIKTKHTKKNKHIFKKSKDFFKFSKKNELRHLFFPDVAGYYCSMFIF